MASILTYISFRPILRSMSKNKPMNAERRIRARSKPTKVRDLNALALILSRKGGHHGDKKKEQARKSCREGWPS